MGAPAIRSTCPYCGVGCGVLLTPDGQGGLAVAGDPDHPANRGRLCSKGSALAETLGLEDRQLTPTIDGRAAGWDAALDLTAARFRETIARHGPDSVAFYVSGQMLTEDYYLANKLMKGFIGSANIDTNSRLCMASTVAGHRRAFGTDTVPGIYDDLEEADLVVLVGSNLAWCHPVLHQRLAAARAARPGMRLVVVDPRRTASCDGADLHLPLSPGSDVALFNALLDRIARRGALDRAFLEAHAAGAEAALAAAAACDPAATGLPAELIARFADMWIDTPRVVTIFSQGVNQSVQGTDKVNAIINCHLATGRIGRPGAGPFSVTGQPNAMGGREVGGLANTLACHLDLENPDHRAAVAGFWQAPALPQAGGLKAVDMFEALAQGRIKAMWVIHSNPAATLPDADAVRDALAACPFLVVSDATRRTDTARLADVFLPAAAWAEKDGTVTNSDRTISRQRAALAPPGQARPDWWILAQIGRRMGWPEAFAHDGPAAIFAEHAALSGIAGGLGRDFDISGLAGMDAAAYDAMTPQRWPVTAARRGGRFFGDGRFFHPDGRARLVAVTARAPATPLDDARSFRLNTGRIRDQWHTMTRTGLSPRLSAHLPEPFVEIHPDDAARLGLGPADLVRLESATGSAILRARPTDAVAPGQLFAPIHWTAQTAPAARIDALVPPVTDPVSGQPESKAAPVAAARFAADWYAFAVSDARPDPDCAYWARARTAAGWRCEMAGTGPVPDWEARARAILGLPDAPAQIMADPARGTFRIAFTRGETLRAALYAGPDPVPLMRDFLAGLPGTEAPWALAGQARAGLPDPGPVVCACFSVGRNDILRAIRDDGHTTLDDIGKALSAGTNCGACKPEINAMLKVEMASAAQ